MENSKKYRFLEALDKIVGTRKRIRCREGTWYRYDISCDDGYLQNTAGGWWPSIEDQKAQIWEIEPGELYLWVEYNEENNSWLCSYSPPGDNLTIDQERDSFEQSGLFSKKKIQKFKLVPVED